LRDTTPIWSDARAKEQAAEFFGKVDERAWYETTGNGFPPPLYSVFKIMWYRDQEPEVFDRIDKIVGTKDFINYRLTGCVVTDHSYASGSGLYDLMKRDYSETFVEASGLPRGILPDIAASTEVIGTITSDSAKELGLSQGVKVVAGGVDNACMALGAKSFREGECYNSLGSSSWIAIASSRPLIDFQFRPYVFAHVVPRMFTSAASIFSAGTSFRWIRDHLCKNLLVEARGRGIDPYDLMTNLASESPLGANRLLFNPSLAGGTALDESPDIRGAFIGLDLRHTQADIIRSTMEGIAFGLRGVLDRLRQLITIPDEILIVGGASRSDLWRQILADVYQVPIVKTTVDMEAAALGAAAVAAIGARLWDDFSVIDDVHRIVDVSCPIPENSAAYEKLLRVFVKAAAFQSELGEMLAQLDL